jgi:hypothetical protein
MHDSKRAAVFVDRFVCKCEGFDDLTRNVASNRDGNASTFRRNGAKQSGTRYAVDVLHGHEEFTGVFPKIDDADDIRVFQRRTDSTFIAEHGDESGIFGKLWEDSLDGKPLPQDRRFGTHRDKYLGHTACAQTFTEQVRSDTNFGSGARQRHDSPTIT